MQIDPPALEVSHTSTVTPDQIDELGHMNVRYYGRNAIAASETICAEYGLGRPALVSAYTRHHHEQMEGNQLEVRSALLGGSPRLRLYHELRNRADNDLAASFVHELDHPALEAPTIELPAYGGPRSLSLDTDGLASAPALDELRERGLAIRKPRTVDEDDTMGADTVSAWLARNLIWGGDRLDEETDWIRELPNGDRWAYVVAESRSWVAPEPVPLGTPIESFGATIFVGGKIAREMDWAYNTETGQPIVALESVDLCFNLSARTSMEIPEAGLAKHQAHLHPEYAPATT